MEEGSRGQGEETPSEVDQRWRRQFGVLGLGGFDYGVATSRKGRA